MNSEQGHSSFAAAGASGLLLPLACEFAPRPRSMHAPPHMTLHPPEICRSRRRPWRRPTGSANFARVGVSAAKLPSSTRWVKAGCGTALPLGSRACGITWRPSPARDRDHNGQRPGMIWTAVSASFRDMRRRRLQPRNASSHDRVHSTRFWQLQTSATHEVSLQVRQSSAAPKPSSVKLQPAREQQPPLRTTPPCMLEDIRYLGGKLAACASEKLHQPTIGPKVVQLLQRLPQHAHEHLPGHQQQQPVELLRCCALRRTPGCRSGCAAWPPRQNRKTARRRVEKVKRCERCTCCSALPAQV